MNDWRWAELMPGVWVPATVVNAEYSDLSELRAGVRKTAPRWVEIMPGVWGAAAAVETATP